MNKNLLFIMAAVVQLSVLAMDPNEGGQKPNPYEPTKYQKIMAKAYWLMNENKQLKAEKKSPEELAEIRAARKLIDAETKRLDTLRKNSYKQAKRNPLFSRDEVDPNVVKRINFDDEPAA